MFTLICVWINGCVNHREAGDLRRYGAHYDVTVMDHYVIKVLCMGVNILFIIKTTITGMNVLTIALMNDGIITHPCPNSYGWYNSLSTGQPLLLLFNYYWGIKIQLLPVFCMKCNYSSMSWLDSGLTKPPLKSGHGSVKTDQSFPVDN